MGYKTLRVSPQNKPLGAALARGDKPPVDPPRQKTMARPSEQRTEYLRVRLTPEEMEQLKRDADTAAVSLSDVARAQLLNAPIPKRKYRRSVDHERMAEVLQQLGKIGGNLNQLAKVANTTGDLSHVRNIRELKAELEAIRDEVRAALTP